jgi:hypothetical protein
VGCVEVLAARVERRALVDRRAVVERRALVDRGVLARLVVLFLVLVGFVAPWLVVAMKFSRSQKIVCVLMMLPNMCL